MSQPPKLNKENSPEVNDTQQVIMDVVKQVRTTPRDQRFIAQNQAPNCWNKYNEWLLCVKNTNDNEGCKGMKQAAYSICPAIWTEKWEEEREENTYPGVKVALAQADADGDDDNDE